MCAHTNDLLAEQTGEKNLGSQSQTMQIMVRIKANGPQGDMLRTARQRHGCAERWVNLMTQWLTRSCLCSCLRSATVMSRSPPFHCCQSSDCSASSADTASTNRPGSSLTLPTGKSNLRTQVNKAVAELE